MKGIVRVGNKYIHITTNLFRGYKELVTLAACELLNVAFSGGVFCTK
jgi:hypothetical protein